MIYDLFNLLVFEFVALFNKRKHFLYPSLLLPFLIYLPPPSFLPYSSLFTSLSPLIPLPLTCVFETKFLSSLCSESISLDFSMILYKGLIIQSKHHLHLYFQQKFVLSYFIFWYIPTKICEAQNPPPPGVYFFYELNHYYTVTNMLPPRHNILIIFLS